MPKKIRVKRYTKPAMFLHWAAALGIFGLFVHGFLMVRMPTDERVTALALHRSFGVAVLVLVVVRIAWRLAHRPPPAPPMPEWQEQVANVMHVWLYALIVVNGVSGVLGWMFGGDPIVFFGIAVPQLVAPIPRIDRISHVVGFVTSRLLAVSIALHVAAALKHQFVDRDRLLARMWLSFTRMELPMRLPVVLTRDEVARLFAALPPSHRLPAKLLYGTGLRLKEAVRLRVQDVDFARHEIRVRGLAGEADRTTMIPVSLRAELLAHVKAVRAIYAREVPDRMDERRRPESARANSSRAGTGPYVFPFASPANPQERLCRHHMSDAELRRILKHALRETCIGKRATPHSLRHSFATHLLEAGQDLTTVKELMGHPDVNATKVYMQLIAPGRHGVVSPLDRLAVVQAGAG